MIAVRRIFGVGELDTGKEIRALEDHRERMYGFLAALFSHPDEGKWGRVLGGSEQRLAIATADALRIAASEMDYEVREGELPSDELDLRFLVVELCQPLEHLKAEYERVLCVRHPRPGCSPFALDYQQDQPRGFHLAELLADLLGLYRAFGFLDGKKPPYRPDHIAYELEFMNWLIGQRRLACRMAAADRRAGDQAERCDLAQRSFFSDHLAGWLGPLALNLRRCTSGGYFEPLGRFLAAWIPLDRRYLDVESRESLIDSRLQEGLSVGT